MTSPLPFEFRFSRFRLLPSQAILLRDDVPVRLGSRATEILILLLRRAGKVVLKQDIMDAVWPDTTVVEANLSVHMSALRRALGDDEAGAPLIVTVPGRGYRFSGMVEAVAHETQGGAVAASARNNLPLLLTRLIGRSDMETLLDTHLHNHRLVTLVGTAGVGKTALALHTAERRIGQHPDGAWMVDLASLSDAELVSPALATILGIELRSDNPVPALIRALAGRDLLILFDNCEHVIEAVAQLANAILQSAPRVTILATSREPLAIPGERILRLEPLETPSEGELVGADRAMAYSSIQLLAERVRANDPSFELSDRDALAASLICRKLGGLPLAIEFASALIPIFGMAGLSSRLDDRLRLLSGGRHSVLPRHRTLDAALDWSFQLLEPHEQDLLLELAVFSGGFTIDAAQAVIGGEGEQIADSLTQLVRKSLVTPDIRGTDLRFRLLEPTRAFLLGRLEQEGARRSQLQRRHAAYFAEALHGQQAMAAARENAGAFVADIDNIRAALTWAMSDAGDRALAIALGAGAVPIWFGLSLLSECSRRADALVAMMTEEERLSPDGAAIDLAITSTQIFLRGAAAENYADWTERENTALGEGNHIERVRMLIGRWTYNIRHPDYDVADRLVADMGAINASEPIGEPAVAAALSPLVEPDHMRATELWMRGTTLQHRGYLPGARADFEHFLGAETEAMRTFWMAITGFDRRSDTLGLLGMTKCLMGDVAAGLADVDRGIAEARTTAKALPVCEALQWAGFSKLIVSEPISVLKPLVAELLGTSKDHSLFSHYGIALCLKGSVALRSGDPQTAADFLTRGLEQLREANYGPFDPFFEGVLAQALVTTGEARMARSRIETFMQSRTVLDCFCSADLIRQYAKTVSLTAETDRTEALLFEACDLAVRQGAAPWRVRAAADLAALLRARERVCQAETEERRFVEGIDEALRGRLLVPVDGSRPV